VVTVRVDDVPPRARRDRLVAAADAIERRCDQPADAVLADYLPRCDTIGRRVRARLIPMGPAGPEVVGRAMEVRIDGALSILTDDDRRVAVRPHHLGMLDLE
jgi:BirA family biotin operon repressor/biotin-[acetyl-CoA-carboxylase] ligase